MYNGTGDNRGDDQKHQNEISLMKIRSACVCVCWCTSAYDSIGKWPKKYYYISIHKYQATGITIHSRRDGEKKHPKTKQ